MVLIPKNGNNLGSCKFKSSSLKNKPNLSKGDSRSSIFDSIKDNKIVKKGLELARNAIISAYDQRKLPFLSKVKNIFSISNLFFICKTIFCSYQEGKSMKEIAKDVVYFCLKTFSWILLCHITSSLMESLVDKILKTGLKRLIVYLCGLVAFPPAPALLFLFDIIISWIGGYLFDFICYLYNKFLREYVERAFNWVKEKAKKAWNWFTGLFK